MKLPKSARLHHRSLQERLFTEGSKIHEFPLKMMWNSLTAEELKANFRDRVPDLIGPLQVLVSVPKKKRRKAVDRVLMRRRIREAYRLGRAPLLEALKALPQVRTVSIGLVYMKEANVEYAEIEEKMRKLVAKLAERLAARYAPEDGEDARNEAPTGEATKEGLAGEEKEAKGRKTKEDDTKDAVPAADTAD